MSWGNTVDPVLPRPDRQAGGHPLRSSPAPICIRRIYWWTIDALVQQERLVPGQLEAAAGG